MQVRLFRKILSALNNSQVSHSIIGNRIKMKLAAHYSKVTGKPAPSGLDFKIYDSITAVPLHLWEECNCNNDLFLSPDYLLALEEAPPSEHAV